MSYLDTDTPERTWLADYAETVAEVIADHTHPIIDNLPEVYFF